MNQNSAFPIVMATTFVLGAHASAQSVISPDKINVTWGDKVATVGRAARPGSAVTDLFRELGAPYATYNVGDTVIYRWGQGSIEGNNAKVVRQHNELLVTTDKAGKVTDVSYQPKFQETGPAAIVLRMPPP